jgi:hypothetical protein
LAACRRALASPDFQLLVRWGQSGSSGAVLTACRRALASPDFQLLVRCEEKCDCGSGEERGKCCHTQAPPEDGGVLWPHFHMCECSIPVSVS